MTTIQDYGENREKSMKRETKSIDRFMTAVELKEPDRIPIVLTSREFGIRYSGYKFSECLKDEDLYIKSQIKCLEDFELDAVWDLWAIPVIAEAFGSNLRIMEDDVPWITEPYALTRPRDLKKLEAKAIDVTKDGRMPYMLNLVKKLKKAVGNDIPVIGWVSTPFRTACMLRGIDNFYKDLFKVPDFAEELLEFALKYSILYGEAMIEAGADIISISNPVASAGCISRKHYERFSFPYEKKMIASLKKKGAIIQYHTCGDWNDRYDLVLETGIDILHPDKIDLKQFKKEFGSKVCLMGGVPSVDIMLLGSPKEVAEITRNSIDSAAEGGGYMISADCALPRDTPADNVLAMVSAAKQYGKYYV